jgi:MtN3 and saliva related transmembrane protein
VRTALGLLAATLTTGAWLPQIARTHRTRHSADISWGYLIAMLLGFAAWLTYGIALGELAIIAANVVSLVLVGSLIVLKLRTSGGLLEDVDPAG